MSLSEDEIRRLTRIRGTMMKMMRDRGYLVGDFEINTTKEELISKYSKNVKREDLSFMKAKENDSSDQIFVYFPEAEKIGVLVIRNVIERIKQEKISRAIIVLQHPLKAPAMKAIDLVSRILNVELFLESEILANVKENVLVPDHQVLTIEEKKILLERYSVKETQLPRILFNDPIARYYGMRRGQVVKIIRPSETAGRYVTYRLCV